jgi:hypothetical protein
MYAHVCARVCSCVCIRVHVLHANRPASHIVASYYQFLRLGRLGYTMVVYNMRAVRVSTLAYPHIRHLRKGAMHCVHAVLLVWTRHPPCSRCVRCVHVPVMCLYAHRPWLYLCVHGVTLCIAVYGAQIAAHLADALIKSGNFAVLNNPRQGSVPLVTFSLLPYKAEVIVSAASTHTRPDIRHLNQ